MVSDLGFVIVLMYSKTFLYCRNVSRRFSMVFVSIKGAVFFSCAACFESLKSST